MSAHQSAGVRLSVMMFLQYAVWGAWLPTARKNKGARINRATTSITTAWNAIHVNPMPISTGFVKIAPMFICMPTVAINR